MRRIDWPERLAGYVERTRTVPFAWGSQDCILWACGAIQEVTGIDPSAPWRGSYRDIKGALRTLDQVAPGGFRFVVEMVAAQHGYEPIAPLLAQRGDAVLCPSGFPAWPESLGVCLGDTAVTTGPHGLVRVPMRAVLSAWRIR